MPWFKTWFDSPYYHILYQHRDEEEAEYFLDNLLTFLEPEPSSTMLDIGCGKGRHSVYLNEKGFVVTGIDLSEKSIAHCLQYENDTLSFFEHDMRKLFRVNDFDYVFNLFTSFGYFETEDENLHVLKNACLALKKNGTFVIDYMNIDYVLQHLVTQETITADHISFHIERKVENGFLLKNISFEAEGEQFSFTEKVAALQLADFEKLIAKTGMVITAVFGDYKLNEYQSGCERLIIMVKKI